MRLHSSLLSVLLASILLAGQLLSTAHAGSHELLQADTESCELCLLAHAQGAGAAVTAEAGGIATGDNHSAAPLTAAPAVPARRAAPIRAPPLKLS